MSGTELRTERESTHGMLAHTGRMLIHNRTWRATHAWGKATGLTRHKHRRNLIISAFNGNQVGACGPPAPHAPLGKTPGSPRAWKRTVPSPRASASVPVVTKATSSLHIEVTSQGRALLPGRLYPLADPREGWVLGAPRGRAVPVLPQGHTPGSPSACCHGAQWAVSCKLNTGCGRPVGAQSLPGRQVASRQRPCSLSNGRARTPPLGTVHTETAAVCRAGGSQVPARLENGTEGEMEVLDARTALANRSPAPINTGEGGR